MIVTGIPFRADKNLGAANNDFMSRLGDDEWACLIDHDAALTTPYWHEQLEEAIAFRPDAGCFTACTNRIISPWQRPPGAPSGDDIVAHRRFGESRRAARSLLDITCTKGFGGVLTLISKRAWKTAGGYADGFYCCDHSIFFRLKDLGYRIYMIEGLYVYHVRASSSKVPPLPAPKVPNCPCYGPERVPTDRDRLYLGARRAT